ncbi:MAG: ABC transporter permease [Alphaproteobacteria bacterium]|nr:ABC transporter permease [Alphaproteobacteria bacterium]
MSATIDIAPGRITLAGELDARHAGAVWTDALTAAAAAKGKPLIVDLTGVTQWDTAGITLLADIETVFGGTPAYAGATEQVRALLDRVHDARKILPRGGAEHVASWWAVLVSFLTAATDGIAFLGEAVLALVTLPTRAKMFRRQDLWRAADQAGVRAIPLVLLLGVLIGLILAFQSLVPMRRFGADLYVANLVAISLIRELGPLLAAVILAGRSGSAFAAEIGTMKVNQEVDALITMGLDPVTMLVLPRLLATIIVMPALTIVLDFAGLIGMALVLVGDGIPAVAIANQIAAWVVPGDLYGALAKSAVFGATIATVGCRAGMATGLGPEAVGVSATRAVVGGIVSAIVLDGIFAIVFYRLGI